MAAPAQPDYQQWSWRTDAVHAQSINPRLDRRMLVVRVGPDYFRGTETPMIHPLPSQIGEQETMPTIIRGLDAPHFGWRVRKQETRACQGTAIALVLLGVAGCLATTFVKQATVGRPIFITMAVLGAVLGACVTGTGTRMVWVHSIQATTLAALRNPPPAIV
jgi:uncharacterized membrane protein YeaQ/YmgE (transglycosylase-associated protein family)